MNHAPDHCNAPTVAEIVSFINVSQAANITILVIGLKINNSQLLMTFAELINLPTPFTYYLSCIKGEDSASMSVTPHSLSL